MRWVFFSSFKKESCFRPGSNRGPCACEAHVITTTLRKLRCEKEQISKLNFSNSFADSSRSHSSTRFSNNADDLTYHTDNEMKRQNYLSKSEEKSNGRKFTVNGQHHKSKESYKGSSYFSNSASNVNKSITNLMLLLILMAHSSFCSYIALSYC